MPCKYLFFVVEVFELFLDFMETDIFPFLKRFLSVGTLATANVEPYRRTNASTSGSFTAKTPKDFPFT